MAKDSGARAQSIGRIRPEQQTRGRQQRADSGVVGLFPHAALGKQGVASGPRWPNWSTKLGIMRTVLAPMLTAPARDSAGRDSAGRLELRCFMRCHSCLAAEREVRETGLPVPASQPAHLRQTIGGT
jgi:hypothetical protein